MLPRDGAAGRLWFEVSDLIAYFDSPSAGTGIQRVSTDIIAAVAEIAPDRLKLCRQAAGSSRLRPVAMRDFAGLCRPFEPTSRPLADRLRAGLRWARRRLSRRLSDLQPVRSTEEGPQPGDTLVCLGAGWEHAARERLAAGLAQRGIGYVVLVHDIIPITHPHLVLARENAGFESWLVSTLRHASLILTASRYTADSLTAFANARGLPTPAVERLPFGSRPAASPQHMAHPQAAGPFVLCVATLEGRKNHRLLLEVWQSLMSRHGVTNVPDLVLVGKRGWALGPLMRDLEASGLLGTKIHHFDGLSDAQVQGLYRDCLFTTLPSLVEGWGLPVIESLSAGKLCLCAERGALPESGGDLVDYFDPDDRAGVIGAFEQAIFDDGYREARAERIRDSFILRTWSDYARDLVALLDAASRAGAARTTSPERAGQTVQ